MPHTIFCNAWIFFVLFFLFLLLFIFSYIIQSSLCVAKMFIVYLGNVFEICSVVYYTNVQRILQIVQHVCPARTPARRRSLMWSCTSQCLGDVPAVAHAVDALASGWWVLVRACVIPCTTGCDVCDLAELALAGCMRELAPDGRTRVVAPARSI